MKRSVLKKNAREKAWQCTLIALVVGRKGWRLKATKYIQLCNDHAPQSVYISTMNQRSMRTPTVLLLQLHGSALNWCSCMVAWLNNLYDCAFLFLQTVFYHVILNTRTFYFKSKSYVQTFSLVQTRSIFLIIALFLICQVLIAAGFAIYCLFVA